MLETLGVAGSGDAADPYEAVHCCAGTSDDFTMHIGPVSHNRRSCAILASAALCDRDLPLVYRQVAMKRQQAVFKLLTGLQSAFSLHTGDSFHRFT